MGTHQTNYNVYVQKPIKLFNVLEHLKEEKNQKQNHRNQNR
jgi:hypothetical protein